MQQHFRIMHRQRYDKCYDLSGEKMIKKLHGDETKELLISMSSYRTKKVRISVKHCINHSFTLACFILEKLWLIADGSTHLVPVLYIFGFN